MEKRLRNILTSAQTHAEAAIDKLHGNKLLVGFVIIASVLVIGTTSFASAAPDYFSVAKPSASSQCYGGHWQTVHEWGWWNRHRGQRWVANWQQLGFSSLGQCIRYTGTNQPTSKADCRANWYKLGFRSRNDCFRYLRDHPGNGYGGDTDNNRNN